MLKNKNHIWLAALINLVLFILFFSFFYPIYDSKEDAYAAYLLSGGFGNPPTEFLHYNYGFHPFLNLVVKNLFLLNGNINWYSISLITGHYISATVILSLLIKKNKSLLFLLSWFALFLVFQGFFLIILDFTGTSVILGCTGFLYLLAKSKEGPLLTRHCLLAGLLLLLASLYRIHAIIPLAGIALPFFFLVNTAGQKLRIFLTVAAAALCILCCNFLQRAYYSTKDPGWPTEETSRQKIFELYNYNSPALYNVKLGQKWYIESQLISRGLLIDNSFLHGQWLDSMYKEVKSSPPAEVHLPKGWTKWFFINNRLFFCITLFILAIYASTKKIRLALALTLLLIAAGTWYLATNAKLPPYILASALYFVCLATIFHGGVNPLVLYNLWIQLLTIALLLFFCYWGIIRLHKTSQQNRWQNLAFKQAYAELAANKDKLFIVTGNFTIHKFYVFDLPRNYTLDNYADTEHFIINLYKPVFEKFHIYNNNQIPFLPNVLFWGKTSDAVRLYFERLIGQPMRITDPLPAFNAQTVWKIVPQSTAPSKSPPKEETSNTPN
jgi:hypothetical protein